ncbi:LamG-like jellyroll fold domain-containing protein [Streptomyces sp. WAC00263]|uniref:LamG-like jellyroll fold domain-containing protein n=1 Tax=Streptomyces sp. WAC00263 TaxID=1917422 RepID=UPI0015EE51D0|nr:LamG-like jellyroll fold domain-containing protein [Streptomyces sp. WAC00263]
MQRRWLRRIALAVSGVLLMVLATQPAEAVINEHALASGSQALPGQRTGSAAGLPHQTGSALTRGGPKVSTASPHKPAAVKGALSADRTPKRSVNPRLSFTGPKSKLGDKRVRPPASVRARMLKQQHHRQTGSASSATRGDSHLPGPVAAVPEITKDRTATTSVFQNPDGTRTARVYSRPVHYRTADGSWADIDTTLTQGSDGRWSEKADSPSAVFAASGDDPALVAYGPGAGKQVSYSLQGAAAVQGRASGNSITYPGIAKQSDATYATTASGVKETLTLHSASAPTTWVFPLHLTGLTPSLAANGSVVFKDASGTVGETIPHGFMEDSHVGEVSGEGAISTGVTYSLTTTSDGSPALKVSLDDAWLRSPDRAFPVTVDPTNLNAASSTYVETPYDINFSTDDTLKVGSYDSGSHKANSYLMFSSFGSTFQNDYIEKASVYLDDVWSGGCTAQPVDVHAITSSWSVGSIADYPGLSYGSSIGSSSFDAGSSCGGSAWHGIDIGDNPSAAGVKLLEGWAHGGTNRGLALTANTSVVAAWKQFASVHSSYPPYLSVTYSPYGADYSIPSQTYTEPTASTTGSMKVTITNRGTTSWSTSSTQLATDIYTTSWSSVSTNATKTYVPSSVSPNSTITMTGTLPALAPGQYYVCWDMLTSGTSFYSTYNVPTKCAEITSADTPPQIDSTLPTSNSVVGSIKPQLFAKGHDSDNYPGTGLTYDFQVYSNPASGSPSLVTDSGWVSTAQWTVPSGKLAWNQSYYWIVADNDGDAQSAWSEPSYFSTTVAQPLITSHLGAAAQGPDGKTFDPRVGNYTASATDAGVSVAGPALSVVRSYNSLDPRTGSLFGAGWSTLYDMAAVPDSDGSGAVVVTTASGQETRFGLNANGMTFTPPQGTYATFQTVSGGGYTLTDKSGRTYTFGEQVSPAWKLKTITDASGRSETLSYNSDGTLAQATNTTSSRSLHFTWSGGRVTQVATDPATSGGAAETWTYSYSGDDLTKVCPPTSSTACTAYSYTSGSSSGSHYRTAVLDANPASYWRLAESSGTSAASEVAVNEGNDNGTYASGVTLGTAGPLPGSPTTAATLNGSSGYVSVPADVLHQGKSRAVSLWFKTSSPGVLIGDQSVAIAGTSTPSGSWTPVLYVGSDGKLHGHWWSGSGSGGAAFGSTGTVNDNAWHHTVLTSDGTTQTLYLDGTQQATLSGTPNDQSNTITYIGAGYAKSWINSPADVSYFHGSIAEVAFYTHALGSPAVQEQYAAGTHAATELTGLTLPSGKTYMAAAYDAVHDRATQITDANGGTWKLASPTTKGSGAYYRSSVMANDPGDYWRLGESSGSQAVNETAGCTTNAVRYCSDGPAVYHNVTLGAPGLYSGGTETAASLNGTSSYVELPSGTIGSTSGPVNVTLELWFKSTTAGGVLFSYQSSPIGTTPSGNYTPALYVGADGHLYGQFWDGYLSPMESDGTVTDGAWHQVALSMGSDDVQTLYLDGKQADQRTGRDFNNTGQSYYSLGAGYLSGLWPAQPSNNPNGYFKGSLAEASLFVSKLSDDAIAADYAARGASNGATPVTTATVTDPGNKTLAYQYDPGHGGRLISATDALGHTVSYAYDTNGFVSTVIRPDGDNTSYTHNARGDVLSTTLGDFYPGGITSYYSYPADGTYSVTDPRNDEPTTYADPRSSGPSDTTYATTHTYNANGDLLTTKDADGNTTTDTYTAGTEAAVGGGTEPAGLPATTKDANGKTTTYAYDSAGDLAQVTAPSGLKTTYAYDALGRRLTATEVSDTYPNGITTTYTYDADDRLLTRTDPATTDAVHGTTTHTPRTAYAYDGDGDITSVAVADTTGGDAARTTSWTYNSHDQVDSVTDPLGRQTSYGYDGYGNRASETGADGNTYSYSYSPTGELLTTTLTNYTGDPVNPSAASSLVLDSRAYDPDGLLASDTDAMGRTTGYKYQFTHWLYSSALTNFHNADGSTSSKYLHIYGYDAAGHVATERDTNALTLTQYTYDPAGRTTQQTFDPSGLNTVTSYSHDGDGNLTSQSVTGGGTTEQTDYTYDTLGDATAETVHNGSSTLVTTHTYDQRGVLTSTTDPRGNVSGATAADYTTAYASDQAGRLTQVTAPTVNAESGGGAPQQIHPITLYGYDAFGDQTSVDDADGNITTYTYDADGEQVAVSGAAYTPPGSTTSITPTTTATYDAGGRVTDVTDADNNATHATYDQLGDVAQIQEPVVGGTTPTSHVTYDTDGEALAATDPTGAVVQATYDDLGRPVTSSTVVRQPSTTTDTTTFGYDEAGNQTSLTLPGGEKPTATYDTGGNLLTATDARGNTTHYAYDLDGRLTKTTLPDNTATTQTYDTAGRLTAGAHLDASGTTLTTASYAYDPAGNPTSVTGADGNTTTYTYDASDAVTQQTEPVSSTSTITTGFGYDAAGNLTRYTDGNNNATITTINTLGLPESTIEPSTTAFPNTADRTTTAAYDGNGNPTTITRPGGVTLTHTYDADGRLTGTSGTGAEATTPSRTFGYDAAGRLTSAGAPGGTDTYTYDDRGEILSASGTSGNATYSYNSDGLLTSRTDKAGTATFTYNPDGQVDTATDPATSTTLTYTYNSTGQVTGIAYGGSGNATRSFGYNAQHRLSSDTLTAPGGSSEAATSYGYDNAGRLTAQTTTGTAGAASNTYGYDKAGRLTSWNNGSTTTGYGYDGAGNRTTVTSGSTTTTANYNARNQVTGTSADSSSTTYAYTARGTLASVTGSQGTENLSYDAFDQLTQDGSTASTHDALGRLATAGNSTFAYDGTGDQPVSDGTETFGRGPDGQLLGVGGSGGAALAYTNQHGDLTGTFTATGTGLAGSTAYDPYGRVLATGGTQHDLGYQGGWTDAASHRVATASRWYDPTTGTFTSHDATSQPPVPSVNANAYAYGDDDPLTNADPSGNNACEAGGTYRTAGSYYGRSYGYTSPSRSRGSSRSPRIDYGAIALFVGELLYGLVEGYPRHSGHASNSDNNYPRYNSDGSMNYGPSGSGHHHSISTGGGDPANSYNGGYAGLGGFELGELSSFSYGSCDISAQTPPPPPPPTAKTGLRENPGKRPAGQATGRGTTPQTGTKTAATGPSDTAPVELHGSTTTPAAYNPAGTATMAAAEPSGGLGSIMPVDPSAGLGTTLVTPVDGSAGAGTTLVTPVDDSAGAGSTTVTPVDPYAGAGLTTSFPAQLQSGHVLHSADGGEEGCSFDPQTPVLMAGGKKKPIGKITPGDRVESADPATGKHRGPREVTARLVHHDDDLVDVTIRSADGHEATLHTTSRHPFWDDTLRTWIPAGKLKPGDVLNTATDHHVRIDAVTARPGAADMYNLTVQQLHTYYVLAGATPILVHNTCGPRVFAVDSSGTATALPVHEIDSSLYPGVAANFDKAIANGESPIVTRMTGRANIRANRNAAQAGLPRPGTIAPGMSWEEFPFASTYEGGSGATTSLIPRVENVNHGRDSLWRGFLEPLGLQDGDQYYVRRQ